MAENGNPERKTATRKCPVCGHEAWRIVYGEVMPSDRDRMPQTEFAGCMMVEAVRFYPRTGKEERGVPKWACQDSQCRHEWW